MRSKHVLFFLLFAIVTLQVKADDLRQKRMEVVVSSSGLGLELSYLFPFSVNSIEPNIAFLWVEGSSFAGMIGAKFYPFSPIGIGFHGDLDYSLCEADGGKLMHNISSFLAYRFVFNRVFTINLGVGMRLRLWPVEDYWMTEVMPDGNFSIGVMF